MGGRGGEGSAKNRRYLAHFYLNIKNISHQRTIHKLCKTLVFFHSKIFIDNLSLSHMIQIAGDISVSEIKHSYPIALHSSGERKTNQ